MGWVDVLSPVFLRVYSDATSWALVCPLSLRCSNTRMSQTMSTSMHLLTRVWDGDPGSVAGEGCCCVWTLGTAGLKFVAGVG
jgi:hypothetical protein